MTTSFASPTSSCVRRASRACAKKRARLRSAFLRDRVPPSPRRRNLRHDARAARRFHRSAPEPVPKVDRIVNRGRRVPVGRILGFLQLYGVAALRPTRRSSLRHKRETEHLEAWLAQASAVLPKNYDLAVEILRCRRLVKGYSDTHVRGMSKFDRVMAKAPEAPPSARTAPNGWRGSFRRRSWTSGARRSTASPRRSTRCKVMPPSRSRDEARTCALGVIFGHQGRRNVVWRRPGSGHRRHPDAVRQRNAAKVHGREQISQGRSHRVIGRPAKRGASGPHEGLRHERRFHQRAPRREVPGRVESALA